MQISPDFLMIFQSKFLLSRNLYKIPQMLLHSYHSHSLSPPQTFSFTSSSQDLPQFSLSPSLCLCPSLSLLPSQMKIKTIFQLTQPVKKFKSNSFAEIMRKKLLSFSKIYFSIKNSSHKRRREASSVRAGKRRGKRCEVFVFWI